MMDTIRPPYTIDVSHGAKRVVMNAQVELFDYINGGDCRFCAIGRASKMVRDSVLLDKIDNALNHFDRVMVTFGHGHAIALSPALQQVVNRH